MIPEERLVLLSLWFIEEYYYFFSNGDREPESPRIGIGLIHRLYK